MVGAAGVQAAAQQQPAFVGGVPVGRGLGPDLSKNRDDWALSEIEQVLSTASQQLQLAGNVQGALIALQNADRSLSRSDKPQFIAIRRAITSTSKPSIMFNTMQMPMASH